MHVKQPHEYHYLPTLSNSWAIMVKSDAWGIRERTAAHGYNTKTYYT